jgi:hypothetical protein
MSACDFDALEALAFEELRAAEADAVRAHVAGCAACTSELGLLRAERGVFAARAKASPPLPGFSAALALSRWSAPEVVPAKAPPPASTRRFPWAVSAFGIAAAAAFSGLFLLPPPGAPLISPPTEGPIVAEPASEDFCHDEAFYNGITHAPKTVAVCEMPEQPGTPTFVEAQPGSEPCGSCAHDAPEEIDTCGQGSCVTEVRESPLPR